MTKTLVARLWEYQAERFPIFRTAVLVFFFTAATLCVSAKLGNRPLPTWPTFAGVWLSVLIIFFQMRVADEHKDYDDDCRYRPERAVPRGLVSLRTLFFFSVSLGLVAFIVTSGLSLKLIFPLGLVWIWLYLMTVEFFVPDWLKPKTGLYLISHMAIMPLIDLYVSAAEWLPHGDKPGIGLWLFYGLSFFNGCVLEFGRKIWSPENERHGVETYSASYGYRKAVWMWAIICLVSAGLLLSVAYVLGTLIWVILPVGIGIILILKVAYNFAQTPTSAHQKWIDTSSGLWILGAYSLAGFVPLWAGI